MTNNNDWKEEFKKRFPLMEQTAIDEVDGVFAISKDQDDVIDFISQNFIPLSSLKKFIEENEKEHDETCDGFIEELGIFNCTCGVQAHNSALKLLKDKFIHNENKQ